MVQNEVSMDASVCAAANTEFTAGSDSAVFINLIPAKFHTVMVYSRKKAQGVSKRPEAEVVR